MLHSSNNRFWYKVQEIMKYSKYLARPNNSYPLFDHATGRCSQIITGFIKYCVVKFTNYFKSNMKEVIKKVCGIYEQTPDWTESDEPNNIMWDRCGDNQSGQRRQEYRERESGGKRDLGILGFGLNEKIGSVVLI